MKQLSVSILLAACASSTTTEQHDVAEVARVEITETATRLEIDGFDALGTRFAHLDLQLGRFTMLEDQRQVDGRRMNIDVEGVKANHESEGYRQLRLPLLRDPYFEDVNAVLLDSRVRPVLARWGIDFEDRKERPLFAAFDDLVEVPATNTCGAYPPSAQCNAQSCHEVPDNFDAYYCDYGQGFDQTVCCDGAMGKVAAHRKCGQGGANPCGGEGSNGCVNCWGPLPSPNSCTTWISLEGIHCYEGGVRDVEFANISYD